MDPLPEGHQHCIVIAKRLAAVAEWESPHILANVEERVVATSVDDEIVIGAPTTRGLCGVVEECGPSGLTESQFGGIHIEIAPDEVCTELLIQGTEPHWPPQFVLVAPVELLLVGLKEAARLHQLIPWSIPRREVDGSHCDTLGGYVGEAIVVQEDGERRVIVLGRPRVMVRELCLNFDAFLYKSNVVLRLRVPVSHPTQFGEADLVGATALLLQRLPEELNPPFAHHLADFAQHYYVRPVLHRQPVGALLRQIRSFRVFHEPQFQRVPATHCECML